jgi:hypothetical protein
MIEEVAAISHRAVLILLSSSPFKFSLLPWFGDLEYREG